MTNSPGFGSCGLGGGNSWAMEHLNVNEERKLIKIGRRPWWLLLDGVGEKDFRFREFTLSRLICHSGGLRRGWCEGVSKQMYSFQWNNCFPTPSTPSQRLRLYNKDIWASVMPPLVYSSLSPPTQHTCLPYSSSSQISTLWALVWIIIHKTLPGVTKDYIHQAFLSSNLFYT
jgi:hypothetical protein